MDPIEHLFYHYGPVEIESDETFRSRTVLIRLRPRPEFATLPLEIRATGVNFRDAVENLTRELQVCLARA